MTKRRCLGTGADGVYESCDNEPEEGEEFCAACADKMMARFRKAWGDIAQQEVPHADRDEIDRRIDGILKGHKTQ